VTPNEQEKADLIAAFNKVYDLVDEIVYVAGHTEDCPDAIREAYVAFVNRAIALANDEEVGNRLTVEAATR
jgi:hypothetical protein